MTKLDRITYEPSHLRRLGMAVGIAIAITCCVAPLETDAKGWRTSCSNPRGSCYRRNAEARAAKVAEALREEVDRQFMAGIQRKVSPTEWAGLQDRDKRFYNLIQVNQRAAVIAEEEAREVREKLWVAETERERRWTTTAVWIVGAIAAFVGACGIFVITRPDIKR